MGPRRSVARHAIDRRNPRLSPTCYVDSSALFKLVIEEKESREAWLYLERARWVGSELILAEAHQAIRARADGDPSIDLELSLGRSEILLQRFTLTPVDRLTLWRAGRSFEPHLRAFDAVHVMTALNLRPIDAFVTYDLRQAEAAQFAGLNVRSPGA